MKRLLIFLSLIVLSAVPVATVIASGTSMEVATASDPSVECAGFSHWVKFDPPPSGTETKSGVTVTSTAWKDVNVPIKFTWTATIGIGRVVVKASNGANVYGNWDPGHFSGSAESVKKDTALPDEPNNFYGISHITFCWNEDEPEEASATASVTSCEDPNATTSVPAYVSVSHADMHIKQDGGTYFYDLTMGSAILNSLTPGHYSITYDNPDPGYIIPAGLPTGFTVEPCTSKDDAKAEADVKACGPGEVSQPVSVSVTGAKMHINGPDSYYNYVYNNSLTIYGLKAGTYTLTYDLDLGYNDPGNLPTSFVIGVCEQATASADPQACREGDEAEPVFLSVDGATMNVSGPGGYSTSLHNESKLIDGLAVGVYTLTYDLDAGYSNPGLPTSFTIYPCEKGDEFYDLSLSVKCVDAPSDACHKWTVTNMNAFPVDFSWMAEAASPGSYTENGSATVAALSTATFTTKYVAQSVKLAYSDGEVTREVSLTDGICEEDAEPDVAAGGFGPSAFSLIAPALIGISGTTLTWILLKRKTKKVK